MTPHAQRILTTHVGSLARPKDLLLTMSEKVNGRSYDQELFADQVRDAVADRVRRQVAAGIDIVCDGEMSKASFMGYVGERLAGFSPCEMEIPPILRKEIGEFPEYYEGYLKNLQGISSQIGLRCTGPISYVGHELLRVDIDNLRAALAGFDVAAFLPSSSPAFVAKNEYYPTHGEYLEAVAEAMREEYLGIVNAGFSLQIDDPYMILELANPTIDLADRRRSVSQYVEILNHALRGIPPEKIRHHVCYSLNHGPRLSDLPIIEVAPFMLAINARAYSFEFANPRHQHEWRVWEVVKLPDGKRLMPGFIDHGNNFIEHPMLIAQSIVQFANLVGRDNVVASANCGFSSQATFHNEVHPEIVWHKFRTLAEGAAIASRELWP